MAFDFRNFISMVRRDLDLCQIWDSEKLVSLERTVPIGVPWPLQAVINTMGTKPF